MEVCDNVHCLTAHLVVVVVGVYQGAALLCLGLPPEAVVVGEAAALETRLTTNIRVNIVPVNHRFSYNLLQGKSELFDLIEMIINTYSVVVVVVGLEVLGEHVRLDTHTGRWEVRWLELHSGHWRAAARLRRN